MECAGGHARAQTRVAGPHSSCRWGRDASVGTGLESTRLGMGHTHLHRIFHSPVNFIIESNLVTNHPPARIYSLDIMTSRLHTSFIRHCIWVYHAIPIHSRLFPLCTTGGRDPHTLTPMLRHDAWRVGLHMGSGMMGVAGMAAGTRFQSGRASMAIETVPTSPSIACCRRRALLRAAFLIAGWTKRL